MKAVKWDYEDLLILNFVVTCEVTASENVLIPQYILGEGLKIQRNIKNKSSYLFASQTKACSRPWWASSLWPQRLEGKPQPLPPVTVLSRNPQLADLILSQFLRYFWIRKLCFLDFFPVSNHFPSPKRPGLVGWTKETSDVADRGFAAKTWLSI